MIFVLYFVVAALYGFLCVMYAAISLICTLIHHCFQTVFLVYLLESLCRKLVFVCLLNLGYHAAICVLYVHDFCFVGSIKLKNDNTSKLGICLHKIGGHCWTSCFDVSKSKWNALRSLLLVVCVSRVFEFVNSLFVITQGCLISIVLKKICFLKEVKTQPIEISIQPVVLHLVYFEKDLKKLDFVWLCYQTNSIDWFFNWLIFWKP